MPPPLEQKRLVVALLLERPLAKTGQVVLACAHSHLKLPTYSAPQRRAASCRDGVQFPVETAPRSLYAGVRWAGFPGSACAVSCLARASPRCCLHSAQARRKPLHGCSTSAGGPLSPSPHALHRGSHFACTSGWWPQAPGGFRCPPPSDSALTAERAGNPAAEVARATACTQAERDPPAAPFPALPTASSARPWASVPAPGCSRSSARTWAAIP